MLEIHSRTNAKTNRRKNDAVEKRSASRTMAVCYEDLKCKMKQSAQYEYRCDSKHKNAHGVWKGQTARSKNDSSERAFVRSRCIPHTGANNIGLVWPIPD